MKSAKVFSHASARIPLVRRFESVSKSKDDERYTGSDAISRPNHAAQLQVELGAAPVTTLRVIAVQTKKTRYQSRAKKSRLGFAFCSPRPIDLSSRTRLACKPIHTHIPSHARATKRSRRRLAGARRAARNLNARSANVPNRVPSAHADPLGKRAVLLLLLPQNLLDSKTFIRRLMNAKPNHFVSLRSVVSPERASARFRVCTTVHHHPPRARARTAPPRRARHSFAHPLHRARIFNVSKSLARAPDERRSRARDRHSSSARRRDRRSRARARARSR